MCTSQTIAQVAAASGLSAATLRFYEDQGLIPPVPRDGSGNRRYGEPEMSRVNTIRCLRTAGLSLPEMKRYFAMVEDGEDTLRVRRELLEQTRDRLRHQRLELKKCLDYLDLKIEHYGIMLAAVAKGEKPPVFSARKLNRCFAVKQRRNAKNRPSSNSRAGGADRVR